MQAIVAVVTNEKNAVQSNRNAIKRGDIAPATVDPFAAGDSFRLGSRAVREIRLQTNENGKR